ncbi:hypothetical protein [Noviherbaspirillum humi]|uniref:hypothetical protein n=1 Tax=Noviherbaspirillum humi TaxID=1688639 RepID=UPI001160B3E0|nr:hypothetical protein [Noviherbaspirillum humi]
MIDNGTAGKRTRSGPADVSAIRNQGKGADVEQLTELVDANAWKPAPRTPEGGFFIISEPINKKIKLAFRTQ